MLPAHTHMHTYARTGRHIIKTEVSDDLQTQREAQKEQQKRKTVTQYALRRQRLGLNFMCVCVSVEKLTTLLEKRWLRRTAALSAIFTRFATINKKVTAAAGDVDVIYGSWRCHTHTRTHTVEIILII